MRVYVGAPRIFGNDHSIYGLWGSVGHDDEDFADHDEEREEDHNDDVTSIRLLPRIRCTFGGFSIVRIVIFGGLYWVSWKEDPLSVCNDGQALLMAAQKPFSKTSPTLFSAVTTLATCQAGGFFRCFQPDPVATSLLGFWLGSPNSGRNIGPSTRIESIRGPRQIFRYPAFKATAFEYPYPGLPAKLA